MVFSKFHFTHHIDVTTWKAAVSFTLMRCCLESRLYRSRGLSWYWNPTF